LWNEIRCDICYRLYKIKRDRSGFSSLLWSKHLCQNYLRSWKCFGRISSKRCHFLNDWFWSKRIYVFWKPKIRKSLSQPLHQSPELLTRSLKCTFLLFSCNKQFGIFRPNTLQQCFGVCEWKISWPWIILQSYRHNNWRGALRHRPNNRLNRDFKP
jgi:hypothetical protein